MTQCLAINIYSHRYKLSALVNTSGNGLIYYKKVAVCVCYECPNPSLLFIVLPNHHTLIITITRPLHNCGEQSQFVLRTAPARQYSEHRRRKIQPRGKLCRSLNFGHDDAVSLIPTETDQVQTPFSTSLNCMNPTTMPGTLSKIDM